MPSKRQIVCQSIGQHCFIEIIVTHKSCFRSIDTHRRQCVRCSDLDAVDDDTIPIATFLPSQGESVHINWDSSKAYRLGVSHCLWLHFGNTDKGTVLHITHTQPTVVGILVHIVELEQLAVDIIIKDGALHSGYRVPAIAAASHKQQGTVALAVCTDGCI